MFTTECDVTDVVNNDNLIPIICSLYVITYLKFRDSDEKICYTVIIRLIMECNYSTTERIL